LRAPFDNNSDDKLVCTSGIYSMEFDGIPRGAIVRGTGAFQTPQAPQRLILPRQKSLKGGGDFRPQFFASAGAGSADVIGATQPGVLASAACGAAK
jgi:hypothetical protein